jgi:WD40 repeat protein
VLTGSRDNTARLWDAATGKEIRAFEGHVSGVTSVAFSPDGAHVVTGAGDTTARLWDAATGKGIRAFKGHQGFVNSVAFSPDGGRVLTGLDRGTTPPGCETPRRARNSAPSRDTITGNSAPSRDTITKLIPLRSAPMARAC